MATNSSGGVTTNSFIQGLQQGAADQKKKTDAIGKNEFLNMLVEQLKNQDPLDPMDGDQFAVNLAQFSQLEQLIGINDKLGGSQGADVSSLASYLGHEVVLNGDTIQVENGEAGSLQVTLPSDADDVIIDVFGPEGEQLGSASLGEQVAGTHTMAIPKLSLGNGEFKFKVRAQTTAGAMVNVGGHVAGVVSGFVPGPEPVLLVGAREVNPGDIKEVRAAQEL